MRKVIAIIAVLLMICVCAAEDDLAAQYRVKYEETVAFKAIKTISRYLSDDLSLDQSVMSIYEKSTARDYLKFADDGYFSTTTKRTYSDFRSENWEVKSETEFCCDVYCLLTINFKTNSKVVEFPCGYHFCFKQMNKSKDFWQVMDYYNLPCAVDAATCERISEQYDGITLYPVTGKTFKGFMMVVDDPSRLFVGTIPYFGNSVSGMRINELVDRYDGAIAAFNGGGFADTGGKGSGGQPYGLVISEGNMMKAPDYKSDIAGTTMGFDADNKLRVGNFGYNTVMEMGLRDALAFHPALVIDGQATQHNEKKLYTIRTAIGQDADGKVLILIIKGRQPDSMGASINDLQEVMLSYGAVNAGNLDGGSSTCLYMGGESVYSGYWPDVSRRLPCAFIIK